MSNVKETALTEKEKSTLGQRLKNLRKIRHLSQEAVAEKLGIMRCTYYHYESGRTVPPAKTLYALAKLYDVSPEMILYPDGDSSSSYAENVPVEKNRFTDKELELVYYYRNMDERAQDDILMFAKLKGGSRFG